MYRILIPLDGSELSEQATALGTALARAIDGFVVLAHIAGATPLPGTWATASEDDEALVYLKGVAAGLPGDINVATALSRGKPAEEIVTMAGSGPPTIVVMSSHGRSGLGRMLFGSVADKVMRTAAVPVVVVPADVRRVSPAIRNLLVPLDGSERAEAVLPLAIEITRGGSGALHVIRVVEPFWSDPATAQGGAAAYLTGDQAAAHDREQATQARVYLSRVAEDIEDQGVRPVWSVRHAKPVDGISDAARESDADLILLSSHGLGGLKRWALGSVASEIVRRRLAPVLVLPAAAKHLEPGLIDERQSVRT